ncbi:MAG TPA: prepilin-type N-terminal cleavage/methylation domain-containing protein [Tepidisphaeraceae bacterium]|nr:prepilin-type N-terminal cleavage/methylation domain-containing protein [Tepidisphaeraceae bacterium]
MSRRRSAFTLVELLVVIGIIAVLIGILLPALNRAREAAKTIACAAQLRSLTQAVMLYCNNNKGYYPPSYLGWSGDPSHNGGGNYLAVVRPFLWDYLEPYGISKTANNARVCPASYDEMPTVFTSGLPARPTYNNQAYSYRYNASIGGTPGATSNPPEGQVPTDGTLWYAKPMQQGKIPRSSRTVLFGDAGHVETYRTTLNDPRAVGSSTGTDITNLQFRAEWNGNGGSNGVKTAPQVGTGPTYTTAQVNTMQSFVDTYSVQHYKKVINSSVTLSPHAAVPQSGKNNVALADGSCQTVTVLLDRYGALPWGDNNDLVIEPRAGWNNYNTIPPAP